MSRALVTYRFWDNWAWAMGVRAAILFNESRGAPPGRLDWTDNTGTLHLVRARVWR